MSESFLHYLWQFQYFDKRELKTTSGEPLQIFATGLKNMHAGPDFYHARIGIGNMEWVGGVEIHDKASGWIDHKHDQDDAYENVVLHVVWEQDEVVKRKDGSLLPALQLRERVDESLLFKYDKLMNNLDIIPCATSLGNVGHLVMLSTVERAVCERLERKAATVLSMYRRNNNDWEETCYQLLAANFGFKVNADPFSQLSLALPYKILLKHADKREQLEALLFGMAGFLDRGPEDAYHELLQREFTLLRQKYTLAGAVLNRAQWKFLRLRPANFPTLRLAQFASLLQGERNIFSKILEVRNYAELKQLFSVRQSAYWMDHYNFGKPFNRTVKEHTFGMGDSSVESIIINAVVPLLAAYGKYKDEQAFMDRALDILQQLPAEKNTILKRWADSRIVVNNAFDSQGLIELFNNFCLKRKCLECNTGASLINPNMHGILV